MSGKNYQVGYGNPPEHTRFKPGQSGNPKGRPSRRAATLKDAAEILAEPATAKGADGRVQRLEALEAAYLGICRKALVGDRRAILDIMRSILLFAPRREAADAAFEREVAAAREAIFRKLDLDPDQYGRMRAGLPPNEKQ